MVCGMPESFWEKKIIFMSDLALTHFDPKLEIAVVS